MIIHITDASTSQSVPHLEHAIQLQQDVRNSRVDANSFRIAAYAPLQPFEASNSSDSTDNVHPRRAVPENFHPHSRNHSSHPSLPSDNPQTTSKVYGTTRIWSNNPSYPRTEEAWEKGGWEYDPLTKSAFRKT